MNKKIIGIVITAMFFGASVIPLINANQVNQLSEIEAINDDIWRDILIYDQPFEAPETAQYPYAMTSAHQENENAYSGYIEYYGHENFWDVNDEISKVVWWGLTFYYNGDEFIPGTPEGMNFKIEFYDDVPDPYYAPPIDLIYSYDVTNEDLKIINTGRIYTMPNSIHSEVELIRFEYELPSTLSITDGDGWISIWSYDDSEQDTFLWPRATEGDGFSFQENSPSPKLEWDLAFQLYKHELDEPPETPTITGEPSGTTGTEYNCTFISTDPEEDNISYCINWGDESGEVCIGPYISGVEASANHTWSEEGDYIIMVKAIDSLGAESEWATLEISMPKNKAINIPLFLQRLFQRFPLFEKILNQII